jgi:hypothetical protein
MSESKNDHQDTTSQTQLWSLDIGPLLLWQDTTTSSVVFALGIVLAVLMGPLDYSGITLLGYSLALTLTIVSTCSYIGVIDQSHPFRLRYVILCLCLCRSAAS